MVPWRQNFLLEDFWVSGHTRQYPGVAQSGGNAQGDRHFTYMIAPRKTMYSHWCVIVYFGRKNRSVFSEASLVNCVLSVWLISSGDGWMTCLGYSAHIQTSVIPYLPKNILSLEIANTPNNVKHWYLQATFYYNSNPLIPRQKIYISMLFYNV